MNTLLLCILCIISVCYCAADRPLVLLISFDGFRWNYLSRTDTPNFDRLIKTGVKAKWIEDIFVSVTYPNHYTIVTGLYAESHGIVANLFYDPVLNATFDSNNRKNERDGRFWGGEPIWVTNQLQGGQTGVVFWPGSQAPIKGTRPTEWMHYSDTYPWTKRVDITVDWLANKPIRNHTKANDINLVLLYFPNPDEYGHTYGPESPEVTAKIAECDSIMGYLLDKLTENGLYDKVNIIITSDHGMTTLNPNRTIPIDPHLNLNHTERVIDYVTGAGIWPKKGHLDSLYEGLLKMGPHAKVWKKEDIPKSFHYNNNIRIPPIYILPEPNWILVRKEHDKTFMIGDHGYNNSMMDMHPFFIAHGPAFRKNYISEPFSSVNIYPLICHLMGIKPAPNNGSLEAVRHLLLKPKTTWNFPCLYSMSRFLLGLVLCMWLFVFIIARMYRRRNRNKLEKKRPLLKNYI